MLVNDGIKDGVVKGCHDKATFIDVLLTQHNGRLLGSPRTHPKRTDIVEFRYRLYARSHGKVIYDADGKPSLTHGKPRRKTTIDDLASHIDEWLAIGEAATTRSIRRLDLPQSGSGPFEEVVEGVSIRGYVRGGEIDTFFPGF